MKELCVLFFLAFCVCFFPAFSKKTTRIQSSSASRGIVISMGGIRDHFISAYALIKSIRDDFKCNISVEIWSYENELVFFPESATALLKSLGHVTLKSMPYPQFSQFIKPDWDWTGDWYKDFVRFSSMASALITTSFDEVLALDLDCVLFVSPEALFLTTQYISTGTLFLWDKAIDYWPSWYPDFDPQWMKTFVITMQRKMHANADAATEKDNNKNINNNLPSPMTVLQQYVAGAQGVLNRNIFTQHLAESSVVLMHKSRHPLAMQVLVELTRGPSALEVYQHVYGDKESYWMACEIAKEPYAFNDWGASHWARARGAKGGDKGNISTSVCPGDTYMEPGALHYMPAAPDVEGTSGLLSLNECKQVGCVQFGIKKVMFSKRRSRTSLLDAFSQNLAASVLTANVSSISSSKLALLETNTPRVNARTGLVVKTRVGSKASDFGRASAGVRRFHAAWLDKESCSNIREQSLVHALTTLMLRRQRMLEAGRVGFFREKKLNS